MGSGTVGGLASRWWVWPFDDLRLRPLRSPIEVTFTGFGDGLCILAAWRGDSIIAGLVGELSCSSTGSGEGVSVLMTCMVEIAIVLVKRKYSSQGEVEDENGDIFDVFVQGGVVYMHDSSVDVL